MDVAFVLTGLREPGVEMLSAALKQAGHCFKRLQWRCSTIRTSSWRRSTAG